MDCLDRWEVTELEAVWNPWHGCRKYSAGCENCYVYRRDLSVGRDPTSVSCTSAFDMPRQKNRRGEYKMPSGTTVYACLTSDFFLDTADEYRSRAWDIIRERQDLSFVIITKRVERIEKCLPHDWEHGWRHVTLCATMEDQAAADSRFPVFLSLPLAHRSVICEPLLGRIDLSRFLDRRISCVTVGGESGDDARVCDYDWVLDIRRQCADAGVDFFFKQTGANFRYRGRIFNIARKDQMAQARKANINIFHKKDSIFE